MNAAIQPWRTVETLRAWLLAQPPGAIVGDWGVAWRCPLARCYRTFADCRVEVYSGTIIIPNEDYELMGYPSLPFERKFINAWDDRRKAHRNTRERALAILDNIERAA